MASETKKLYLSRTEKIMAGVCGGLAKYFEVDPVIIRVIFIGLGLFHGIGILIYIILMIIVPKESQENVPMADQPAIPVPPTPPAPPSPAAGAQPCCKAPGQERFGAKNLLAVLLIVIGFIFLAEQLLPGFYFRWDIFWPVVLILLGVAIILK